MVTATELTNGLSRRVLVKLQAVFARYPMVERVLLFGSRATGFAKPGSDIDLAVIAPGMSQREVSRLWNIGGFAIGAHARHPALGSAHPGSAKSLDSHGGAGAVQSTVKTMTSKSPKRSQHKPQVGSAPYKEKAVN